jgi:hypothetical protein
MTRRLSVLLTLVVVVAATHREASAFAVTGPTTSAYVVDGSNNPTLMLNRGSTYIFNVNATGHPFFIKTVDNSTGTGSQWTLGVTNPGVQVGTLTFVVPMSAPDQLFYHCSIHSAMGGHLTILGPVGVGDPVPSMAWLGRAIPNPAKDGASFRVGLPRDAKIDVVMFDTRGRKIRTLWNGTMTSGEHSIAWDGRDESGRQAASGSYFYRLRVEGRTLTGRLIVAR